MSDAWWVDPHEIRCTAGQTEYPHDCNRHSSHHYCDTCKGYYGVPHDSIHEGPFAHPDFFAFRAGQCACRPCQTRSAEIAARQSGGCPVTGDTGARLPTRGEIAQAAHDAFFSVEPVPGDPWVNPWPVVADAILALLNRETE